MIIERNMRASMPPRDGCDRYAFHAVGDDDGKKRMVGYCPIANEELPEGQGSYL